MDNGQDVKESVDTSVAEPSTAEGEEQVESGEESSDTSAETLNTESEKTPEHIPYSRFKEVNESKKQMEERLKQMEHYQQFDEVLANNPDLFNKVKDALQGFVQGEQQGEMGAEDPVQNLQGQVQQLVVQRNIDAYQNDFNKLTVDMSDGEKRALEHLTEIQMYRMTNQPYARYYPGFIEKAFKEAKKLVDDVKSGEKASYVKAKEGDVASTTRGGTPVVKTEDFDSREKRSSYIAKALKAGA